MFLGSRFGARLVHGIQTDDVAAKIVLHTADCHLLPIGCEDPRYEIPTEWRVWDSISDKDGELDPGELVDTGWLPVAKFIETFDDRPIIVPPGWVGKICFQARMIRRGLGDSAGDYSASLTVEVKLDGTEG